MIDLLHLYYPNIIAGSLMAVCLSLIGCQVAARDRSMHTLCISQGVMFGVLIGIVLFGAEHSALPYFTGLAAAVVVGFLTHFLTRSVSSSVSTYFIAFFLVLLAVNHILGSLFPQLESHVSQIFFGDLATVTSLNAWISTGVALVVLALVLRYQRQLSKRSFEGFVFQDDANLNTGTNERSQVLLEVGLFFFVCFAIQLFGFLFTVGCLFIPTVFLSLRHRFSTLYAHLTKAALAAGIGVLFGLPLTLQFENLPTVPSILVIAAVLAFSLG